MKNKEKISMIIKKSITSQMYTISVKPEKLLNFMLDNPSIIKF